MLDRNQNVLSSEQSVEEIEGVLLLLEAHESDR